MTAAPGTPVGRPRPVAHDAIVLAGGRASRLGGIDKTALMIDGVSLAARAIGAVTEARAVAYVAHAAPPRWVVADRRVRVASEDPPWAGPVAAIAAGLDGLADDPQPYTVVLAGDLVGGAAAVAALLARVTATRHGIVGVDPDGRSQPLLAVYRTAALATAVGEVLAEVQREPRDAVRRRGASMRAVLLRLELRGLELPASWCADIDTPADAAHHGIELPTPEVRHVRVA